MQTPTTTMEPAVLELHQKLDRLVTQVEFLTEEAHRHKQRQQTWDDLKNDFMPVGNELYRLSVEQLEEVQEHVQLEDLLRLLKRLLRNTRNLDEMLNQFESLTELWQELSPLSKDVMVSLMQQLNAMEQKGYFTFAQGGLEIADRVVTSFTEEDVRQLGDNIVLILQTIKEMTQPEIMHMLRTTAHIVADDEPLDTSFLSIMRQLNDPSVKKGLAKTLQVLKSVAETETS